MLKGVPSWKNEGRNSEGGGEESKREGGREGPIEEEIERERGRWRGRKGEGEGERGRKKRREGEVKERRGERKKKGEIKHRKELNTKLSSDLALAGRSVSMSFLLNIGIRTKDAL